MSRLASTVVPGKTPLAFLPTPLEPLPRLSAHLGGAEIWVKRDDCTGLGGGGNKTRKLEYLMATAIAAGADTVITAGALQSNHARQTAAAAARLGLRCILVLAAAVPGRGDCYDTNGNMLLDRLFGAEMRLFPAGTDLDAEMAKTGADLSASGARPYLIPIGGSNGIGALAYAAAMEELDRQCREHAFAFDHIVTATGSGGTQAGMIVGAKLAGMAAPIHGISVSASSADMQAKLEAIAEQTLELLPHARGTSPILVDDAFVGAGYGQPTDAMWEALSTCARLEGLLLDPVYTGKAMAGLFAYIRSGRIGPQQRVLFWHTGGAQGLFGYEDYLTPKA
ncbi:D-cysteine desulfhydrase family protein [Ancylobacter pratisalsi]|uniref:D-cysteine desulfhydrase family protein n=1 Tax=Ancylobacter pratisalsi TaxID=1745854 RepID=A0A6P1YPD3_9HYPH|nr:D-cysteine desulfhydrase family protein [Ancylobacter pratisalsi]QIB34591.1 D-cysteine desulfhydrase family protein [Ancylobacter pratisalsi]